MKHIILIIYIFFYSSLSLSDPNTDQWKESIKTYKDLIDDGFEIKSYDTSIIVNEDLNILLFITVLQKNTQVYECQEYQTMNKSMVTLNMSFICKELVQPFVRGLGT
jgi:hypothetical protein